MKRNNLAGGESGMLGMNAARLRRRRFRVLSLTAYELCLQFDLGAAAAFSVPFAVTLMDFGGCPAFSR